MKENCQVFVMKDEESVLNGDLGRLYKLTRNFRKRKGFSKDIWKQYATYNNMLRQIDLLEALMDFWEDDVLIVFWCMIGLRYESLPASQGRLESSFNPIQASHTPNRASTGATKLRRLSYCYNHSRNIKRFKATWKPNDKKHMQ
eukprot:26497_1